MYAFMYDPRFNIAFEKSEELLKEISDDENYTLTISKIMTAGEKLTNSSIKVADQDFSKLSGKSLLNYGVMMSVRASDDDSKKDVFIIVNSESTPEKRRFSLVHELGHLMTEKYTIQNIGEYTLSAHIDWEFDFVDKRIDDELFLNEQIANVFALLVLVPQKLLILAMKEMDDLNEIAQSFGITKSALLSRIELTSYCII